MYHIATLSLKLPARIARLCLLVLFVVGLPVHGQGHFHVPKMVFAHYMVCCPATGLGATVADFKREIEIAQAAGLDGFALNTASWTREPRYHDLTRRILEAAEAVPSFKVFLSFDGVSAADSAPMLIEAAKSPAYLRIEGRPLVSTYAGTPDWGKDLEQLLARSGVTPFLVPDYLYLSNEPWARPHVHPGASFLAQLYRDNPEIDGYFSFGPDLDYPKPPIDIPVLAQQSRLAGKVSMVGISPYYRGLRNNLRVFESGGFEGMAAQWTAAIESGADWVEIVTWNDWGEATYVEPYGAPKQQELWNYNWGPLLDHEAYLRASRYYIDWFKSSRPPPIEHPAIYYFYRLHAKSAYGIANPDTGEQGRPKGWEDLTDAIYVTSFLPKSLDIELEIGDRHQAATLKAGVQHSRFEIAEGPITIKVLDQGRPVAEKQLEFPITKLGQIGNFNYFTGEISLP